MDNLFSNYLRRANLSGINKDNNSLTESEKNIFMETFKNYETDIEEHKNNKIIPSYIDNKRKKISSSRKLENLKDKKIDLDNFIKKIDNNNNILEIKDNIYNITEKSPDNIIYNKRWFYKVKYYSSKN